MRSLVRILPGPYISAMHLCIRFFVTDFVCKTLSQATNFSKLNDFVDNFKFDEGGKEFSKRV